MFIKLYKYKKIWKDHPSLVTTKDVNGAGRVRAGSNSPVPYPLDKYSSRTRTYIRRVSVMRVPAYFFHICEYPRVPADIYKNILKNKYLTIISA